MEVPKILNSNLIETITSQSNQEIVNDINLTITSEGSLIKDILSLYTTLTGNISSEPKLLNSIGSLNNSKGMLLEHIHGPSMKKEPEKRQTAIYVLEDLDCSNKGHKVGKISGCKHYLRSQYIRSMPHPNIVYFKFNLYAEEVERQFKQIYYSYRVSNDKNNKSEWFLMPLDEIIRGMDHLILTITANNEHIINPSSVETPINNTKVLTFIKYTEACITNTSSVETPVNVAHIINPSSVEPTANDEKVLTFIKYTEEHIINPSSVVLQVNGAHIINPSSVEILVNEERIINPSSVVPQVNGAHIINPSSVVLQVNGAHIINPSSVEILVNEAHMINLSSVEPTDNDEKVITYNKGPTIKLVIEPPILSSFFSDMLNSGNEMSITDWIYNDVCNQGLIFNKNFYFFDQQRSKWVQCETMCLINEIFCKRAYPLFMNTKRQFVQSLDTNMKSSTTERLMKPWNKIEKLLASIPYEKRIIDMCMIRYYVDDTELKCKVKSSSIPNKFQEFFDKFLEFGPDKHAFQIELSKVFVDNWVPHVTNRSASYTKFLLYLEQQPMVKKTTIKGYPKFKGVAPRNSNILSTL
jgi:hypothetical protein